jgi:hypothetical protein
MKMNQLFLFLILITSVSCNQTSISPLSRSAAAEIPQDLVITLERTGCHATVNVCPTYTVTVKADGTVVFEGKEVTATKGRVEGKLEAEKIRQLIGEFEKADYFNLEDSYDHENCPVTATDQPDANTSLQMNGRKKSVRHNLGCYTKDRDVFPPELFALENRIDEIVGTKKWIGERK